MSKITGENGKQVMEGECDRFSFLTVKKNKAVRKCQDEFIEEIIYRSENMTQGSWR